MRPIDADALIEKCGDWYVEEGTESGFIGTLKNLLSTMPTVQHEKAQLSKEGTTKDTISRQAALEKVRTMQTYKLSEGDDMILVDKTDVQTELMMLSPVQPEVLACGNGELIAQPEAYWIPVSERLPESGAYCLFTVFEHDSELEATTIETVYGCFNDYGERRYWSWEDEFGKCCIEGEEQLDGYHDEIIEKVLAWMPLPEPYKPNNE